ncbi:MAG: hypothetical protein EOR22_23585 [Mesorhizobium sp.]|nr:MAG: hypothetical protein EOR22_23585 [Mesorhizobium sp.]
MTLPARITAEPAARLREMSASLQECIREGRPNLIPLKAALDRHLDDGTSLDDGLGVAAAGRGATPPWKALRILDRNQALRDLAAAFGIEGEGVVDAMHDELTQFATWKWPKLRLHQECPTNLDEIDGLMWLVLKLSGGRVLGFDYMAELIAPE